MRIGLSQAAGAYAAGVLQTPGAAERVGPQERREGDAVKLSLSAAARQAAAEHQTGAFTPVAEVPAQPAFEATTQSPVEAPRRGDVVGPTGDETSAEEAQDGAEETGPKAATELDEQEQDEVRQLSNRDREVRVHEQAHKSAGGQYAGAIHYDYEQGPDGKRYVVGGHVNIDVAPVKDDPEATVRKMGIVRRAALAPAQPSGADRQVAARAASQAAQAQAELAVERVERTDDEAA